MMAENWVSSLGCPTSLNNTAKCALPSFNKFGTNYSRKFEIKQLQKQFLPKKRFSFNVQHTVQCIRYHFSSL